MKKISISIVTILLISFTIFILKHHFKGIKNERFFDELRIDMDVRIVVKELGEPHSVKELNDSTMIYFYHPPLLSSKILEIRFNPNDNKIDEIYSF